MITVRENKISQMGSVEADLNGNTELHLACMYNNPEVVARYLKLPYNVNAKNKFSRTPLYFACFLEDITIAANLIASRADINACDDFGVSPLHVACETHNEQLSDLLLKHGADPSLQDIYGCNVLHQCAVSDNHTLAKKLVGKLSLDSRDKFNNTPLHTACAYKSLSVALLLVNNGADIKSSNTYNMSPLSIISEMIVNEEL